MITRETLEEAPCWTPIKGKVLSPGPVPWMLFDPGDATGELEDRFFELGYKFTSSAGGHHPEVIDEKNRELQYDDLDAALAYLQAGGTLIKVPRGGACWRCYAVKKLRSRRSRSKK